MSDDRDDSKCKEVHKLQSEVKWSQQQLLEERKEKKKLLTRLKGYETVGKLASEQQSEINDLKNKNKELQKQVTLLSTSQSGEWNQTSNERMHGQDTVGNNDLVSSQHLTDLQNLVSSSGRSSKSSASFSIIGKSSRDALPVESCSTSKSQSWTGCSDVNSLGTEFTTLSLPKDLDESSVCVKGESSNQGIGTKQNEMNPEYVSHQSTAHMKAEEFSPKNDSLSDFIQVCPDLSQSGNSDLFVTSLDPAVTGGQSCTNSSRRGPMSLIAVNNGSLPSYQYVEVQKTEAVPNKGDKSTASHNTDHDLFSGTGARPKGVQRPSTKSGEEVSTSQDNTSNSISEHPLMMMVKIPNDNSDSYRINNVPMLSYGRQESQTEISALTSFGSSLQSFSPEKLVQEPVNYNNLNQAKNKSQSSRQALTGSSSHVSDPNTTTQEEFVIIEDVPPPAPLMNAVIPLAKESDWDEDNVMKETNAVLMKELEFHRRKTNQLHLANKEWKDRWDVLKKQKEDENLQLHASMRKQMLEMDRIKKELEYTIASQKEELSQSNILKKEAEKAYKVLLNGSFQEKQLLEKLKQDYGTLHQEKRSLEIQLETLRANKHTELLRPSECVNTNSELETELAVIKRQVRLFQNDFYSENQERLALEHKLKKEKETQQSLEIKLKKSHTLLKSRDEDLRKKSKQVADLQFQVDDLKLKLEVEQRRASIYPSMDLSSSSMLREQSTISYVPRDTIEMPDRTSHNIADTTQRNVVASPKPQKWNCNACTFANKISHKKCEMCGTSYTSTEGRYNLELAE